MARLTVAFGTPIRLPAPEKLAVSATAMKTSKRERSIVSTMRQSRASLPRAPATLSFVGEHEHYSPSILAM